VVGRRPSAVISTSTCVRRNLRNAGVRHVELAEHCTACRTDLFFSHRAEKGRTGRFGVVLGL